MIFRDSLNISYGLVSMKTREKTISDNENENNETNYMTGFPFSAWKETSTDISFFFFLVFIILQRASFIRLDIGLALFLCVYDLKKKIGQNSAILTEQGWSIAIWILFPGQFLSS